jgi:pimeloyl-ACP methyl ester carboxylesterase
MAFEMPVDPREARRTRLAGWAATALVIVLIGLLVYLAYAGFTGSDQLVHPTSSTDCELPSALGWSYEAINYDQSTDAVLAAEPDPQNCTATGQAAGTALQAADGTPLAGWYIPAVAPIGPAGPTVVIVHGFGSNKSRMLPFAAVFHDDYNVVLFDQRNHGQSGGTETTLGVREGSDLEAVVEWLRATHNPSAVAVFGSSMGAATALGAIADGMAVNAVILDSAPASLAAAAQRRVENMGYPLSLPVSWAILLGTLFRTGIDVTAADPELSIRGLGHLPVLVLQGGADEAIDADSAERLAAAGTRYGAEVEVQVCAGAHHSELITTCPDDYRAWVLGFLARSLTP